MRPFGVMFHHFRDRRHPAGQGAISADDLRDMIRHVSARGRVLQATDFLDRATTNRLRDGDVCLTFDDNLRCQYDVAFPVLSELGLTAFWFACTSAIDGGMEPLEVYRHFRTTRFATVDAFYDAFFAALPAADVRRVVSSFDPRSYLAPFPFYTDADRRFRFARDEVLGPDRYHAVMDGMVRDAGLDVAALSRKLTMTADHLRALHAAGHVVGLHSHTHPTRLERLSPAEQRREYVTNLASLTRILGPAPATVSHPCNSYGPETLAILRSLGVRLGFRSNMATTPTTYPELELPREDHANVLRQLRTSVAA